MPRPSLIPLPPPLKPAERIIILECIKARVPLPDCTPPPETITPPDPTNTEPSLLSKPTSNTKERLLLTLPLATVLGAHLILFVEFITFAGRSDGGVGDEGGHADCAGADVGGADSGGWRFPGTVDARVGRVGTAGVNAISVDAAADGGGCVTSQ